MNNVNNQTHHLSKVQETPTKNSSWQKVKEGAAYMGGTAGIILTLFLDHKASNELGCWNTYQKLMSLNITVGADQTIIDEAFINAGLNKIEISNTLANCGKLTSKLIPRVILFGAAGALIGIALIKGTQILANKIFKTKEDPLIVSNAVKV